MSYNLLNYILNCLQSQGLTLNDNRFYFKRHLLPILQDSIYRHIINIFRHRQHDMIFKMMVDNDFQRVKSWTEYVDEKPKHAHKPIGRKIMMSGGLKSR
ncbi:MAG: hypothetical protein E6L04_05330 [Thaumarchaeota archaeon]|nr:MAG: hypothetical protein E6L04_05330 [Nitrososphaerota archaeon]